MTKFCEWIINLVPSRLLAEPERFTLAFCFFVIGFDAVFLGGPSSVFANHPQAHLLNLEYGSCMMVGSVCKAIGLWNRVVWLQRLGAAFLVMGCLGIVLGVWLYVGKGGVPVAIIYVLFALTYTLRILSSTLERYKLHRGVKDL